MGARIKVNGPQRVVGLYNVGRLPVDAGSPMRMIDVAEEKIGGLIGGDSEFGFVEIVLVNFDGGRGG